MPNQVEHEGKIYVRDPYWEKYEQTIYEDINGDGGVEVIVRFRDDGEEGWPTTITAIYDVSDGRKTLIKTIAGGETPKGMDLFDVDNDGVKDLILYDHSGNHYTIILIYSFKDNDYRCLFKNGTACYVHEVNTKETPVRITIGRENWENEEFCYANSDTESLLEVWEWDGEKFAYSSDLSTTPIITEKEAIERTWQSMKKNMEENKEGQGESDNQWSEIDTEFAAKGWIAGSRSLELFKGEREETIRKKNKQFLDECTERFAYINNQLRESLSNKDKAELLCEKAWILLTAFQETSNLEAATNCLLEAIQLAPENDEYKEFLSEVYERLWRDKDFSEYDEASRSLNLTKDKVEIIVATYRLQKEHNLLQKE